MLCISILVATGFVKSFTLSFKKAGDIRDFVKSRGGYGIPEVVPFKLSSFPATLRAFVRGRGSHGRRETKGACAGFFLNKCFYKHDNSLLYD